MQIDMGASLRVAQAKYTTTGSELSRSLGCHPQQLCRHRTNKDMKISTAVRFAEFFGISLSEFIELGVKNG